MSAGCTGELRAGVLHLILDTKGSSLNVFTPATALEMEKELRQGLLAGARAVVLRSTKQGSFVNGVGLLLAASSHSRGAAMERARTLQRCYESLAAAPVPTIAAIEGNCYGCGLELALTCDYRIARDSFDTHFYMPELRDYAFIPLFGGTQRLPRLLGLPAAMEVLLGERIDARRALRLGLLDRLTPGEVGRALPQLLRKLRARGWPKRAPRRTPAAGRIQLDRLPGPERRLAREGLRLSRLPFEKGYRLEEGLREELASFWKSLGRPESARAMSFFFVRQAAKAYAIGSAAYSRPARMTVRIDEETPALRRLAGLLRKRRLPGVRLGRRNADVAFAREKVPGVLTCALGATPGAADCAAFLPFPGEPVPAIELVPAGAALPWQAGAPLFQLLEQAGFAPIVTRARGAFVAQRFLDAFASALGRGDDLLEFGFRLPRPLRGRQGRARDVVAALAGEAVRALDDGSLQHPSQADLLAHALFGFPVIRGGLLRHAATGTSAVARGAARVLGRIQAPQR